MRLAKGKEITVLSARELSLKFTGQFLTEDTIVILLSMENYDYPVFKEQENVLKIEVQDTLMKDSPYAFTVKHGLQVKEFLDKACFKRLFVCCDSGESRSAALAAAIMVYYGNPDMEIWKNPYFHPNLLVYDAQLKAFGIKCTPLKQMCWYPNPFFVGFFRHCFVKILANTLVFTPFLPCIARKNPDNKSFRP